MELQRKCLLLLHKKSQNADSVSTALARRAAEHSIYDNKVPPSVMDGRPVCFLFVSRPLPLSFSLTSVKA